MDELARITIANQKSLTENPRRAFNVRINGEEHSASSRDGVAQIFFPMDGQLMQVSQLAFKLIINDGIRAGGSTDPTDNPYHNWNYGLQTYKTYPDWLARYPVGSSVNVDNTYGCTCWDYAAAFWAAQVNHFPATGPVGAAYEMWTVSADYNTFGGAFALIYNWKDIRPGDWVVWGKINYGHIAMATGCTLTNSATTSFRDQNGPQGMVVGDNVYGPTLVSGNKFLGAFRYNGWTTPGCGAIA